MMSRLLTMVLILISFLSACKTDKSEIHLTAENMIEKLQETLINAKEGDEIVMPPGIYEFLRPISFNDVPNVTIRGSGMEKTVLSFKNQLEGGEGFLVKNADHITLEGFTVQDSKGDGIKVQDCNNVIMRALHATWTNGKSPNNGGYGLYPVSCTKVLVDNCRASFAMDAGIYVGQCTDAIVRNSVAAENVAGIEIENTINADVYNNRAFNNAGGLMIFDMPDLPQANGANIKIHDNLIQNNNGANFSSPGMVVNMLAPGTGMLIMAHHDIDVFNNLIEGHNGVSVAIVSWLITGEEFKSKDYDPYCHALSLRKNAISMGEGSVDTTTRFGQLFATLGGGQPLGILTDGLYNPAHIDGSGLGAEHSICIRQSETPLVDLDLLNSQALSEDGIDYSKLATAITTDASRYDCEREAISLPRWLQ